MSLRRVTWMCPAAALALSACGAPPRCPEPAIAAPTTPPATSAIAAAPPAKPRLEITVRPRPRESDVAVELVAAADAAALARFSISPDPGTLGAIAAEDDAGPLTPQIAASDGRAVVSFARATAGRLRLRYTVASRARPFTALPGVDVDPNRFLAAGEPLLLLPDALDDRTVEAAIDLDLEAYHGNSGERSFVDGASSFGVGSRQRADLSGRELRRGFYVIGSLGRARFDGPEGHDEAAWLGYTSFDPRPIAADVAGFRTAVRELFRGGDDTPLTLLVLADARPAGAFAATRRARSVVVRVGAGEAWTGPVRIAAAVEILRAWIGERLWVGPDDPAHEAESYWFTEGITRHLARDLLFRFGLVTSREVEAEVNALLALEATSPLRAKRNAELAATARSPGAVPLLVARGALYGARLHALLKAQSKGTRGLPDVLRDLYSKAREKRGPLPTSAFIDAVRAALGPAEAAAFARIVDEGRAEDLPADALGPCFRPAPRTYEAYDLGFDEDATRASPQRAITGLRPGGPAERAGLRAGDVLVEAVIGRGRSDVPVTIKVDRAGESKSFKYLPAGAKAKGKGFSRKSDVAEEACAR